MAQDITALKQSFDEEYRAFLKTAERGSREIKQGELFHKYKQLGLSAKDMAQIIQAVDSETKDKTSKLESYVRRVGNCIKEFESRSDENLDQENTLETLDELVDLTEEPSEEQTEESSTAESEKSETELQLDTLRDEINKHDQNIADNVIAIGEKLLQAKSCVKRIKKLKWQSWLAGNIKMPRQTANKYMNCTTRFKENVSLAGRVDLSKINVSQMFELLSVPKDKLEQFFTDLEDKNVSINNMTKNELRDLIKNWKQNNIVNDKKPKEKFIVRFSIAEQDRRELAEMLKTILATQHTLTLESAISVEKAIKSIENIEPSTTDSEVAKE